MILRPKIINKVIIFEIFASRWSGFGGSAAGLGISEFMLWFMAWSCLKGNALSGSQHFVSYFLTLSIYEFHHLKLEELVFAANFDVGVAI